jgi:hypothetical protein
MIALAVTSLALLVPTSPSAGADSCVSSSSSSTDVAAGTGLLNVSAGSVDDSSCVSVAVGTDLPAGEWVSHPYCLAGGSATCEEFAECEDGTTMVQVTYVTTGGDVLYQGQHCASDATAEVTGGMVLNALRRLPLPPSDLIVQPPNGRTLVYFDTNFYTEATPLDRTLRLLGQRVDLRIWPSSYEWNFGDGEAIATESAGAPYPDLEITHSYTTKGQVGPAVDTTYAAEFRVNAGPWRPVPGTVTIPGDTVALEVVEATPTLVGYR